MLLASNKQQEITKNRKTQQDRQNTQKRTAGKNKDQAGITTNTCFCAPNAISTFFASRIHGLE
jgi:hypothetical protein